jgi:hypothetical protein
MEETGHKTCGTYVGTKAILKGCKSGLFAYFGQFPCSWIQIRIPSPKDLEIRIHNTVQDIFDADPNLVFKFCNTCSFITCIREFSISV